MDRPRGCSWPDGTAPMGSAWSGLRAADVSSFLARECPKRSVSGARDLVCALRSLIALPASGGADRRRRWCGRSRRLRICGIARCRAAWNRRQSRSFWPPATGAGWSAGVTSRSCCCCRGSGCAPGRSPGCASMTSTGVAASCSFAARAAVTIVLPLPVDVGEAVVSYLRRRPRCECRALFLRVTAPRQGLNRSTIGWVVRAACDRAGSGQSRRPPPPPYAPRPRCSGRARRWRRSARCFATASRRPPRSTPRSTAIALRRARAPVAVARRCGMSLACEDRSPTICGSAAGSGSRCPRTAACWKVSSSSSSKPALSGSRPSWR